MELLQHGPSVMVVALDGDEVVVNVHVFEGTDLTPAETGALDPDEDIEVERRQVGAALTEVSEASSIAALALWRANG